MTKQEVKEQFLIDLKDSIEEVKLIKKGFLKGFTLEKALKELDDLENKEEIND